MNGWDFDYTGTIQSFTVPKNGIYSLEVWGAQGGGHSQGSRGGYGGYSIGGIFLKKNTVLYIVVGGAGTGAYDPINGYQVGIAGGYNGGGKAITWVDTKACGSGGGATHIALVSGVLSSLSSSKDKILIVAGGGGGGGVTGSNLHGGDAGGYKGSRAVAGSSSWTGDGGSQTSGAAFGQGGNASAGNTSGGGGGFYGGYTGTGNGGYGGGGSSYIGSSSLQNIAGIQKLTMGYSCATSTDESTYTISTTAVSSNPMANYTKMGNGYARINLISAMGAGNRGYIIAR